MQRDKKVYSLLTSKGVGFFNFKDHVVFDRDEVVKKDGLPYTVFTPYKRRWLEKLNTKFWEPSSSSFYLSGYPNTKYFDHFNKTTAKTIISMQELGFEESSIEFTEPSVSQKIIKEYTDKRDFPALNGTSRLGIHFRFGTISIREKARKAQKLNATFLSELIWRDFYAQILYHFPHVEDGAFRPKYNAIPWSNNEDHFEKWCQGKTGYLLVDAGMRELNETGFMHNRIRMLVASFLTKHLLINWQWGEAYFASKLLDFDLASNNGGWQWAAGCGTDAAPYFRIFNPASQLSKFDKEFKYVKKWVPEYGTDAYPKAIVEHKWARERCLETYKSVLKQEV